MSIKAMSTVWERSRQCGSSLLMLLAIADYAKDDGSGAFPSLSTLAEKTRMGRRNAIKVIAGLVSSGELQVHTGLGPFGTNLYDIHFPSEPWFTPRIRKLVNYSSPPSELQFTNLVNPSSSPSELQFTNLVNPSSPNPLYNHHESVMESVNNAAIAADPDALRNHLVELWGVRRVNRSQAEIIAELERYDPSTVIEAARWAHVRGMAFGQALAAMKKIVPNWGKEKPNGQPSTLSDEQRSIAASITPR